MRNKTCKKYKSCKNVPCNSAMNRCKPSYCVPDSHINGSSRNWNYCNMSNWGKKYRKYKKRCKSEKNCILNRTSKITKNTVDALILHNKMPYIWRFLKPTTRKYMIELANKSKKKINIPFDIFPDNNNIYNYTKNMTYKNKQLFLSLRKKYKSI